MGEKVVVFGSYVQEYISRQQGLPVPGQTLVGSEFLLGRGGKGGNQAVAAHRAGADITYITKVGRDAAGEGGKAFFEEQGSIPPISSRPTMCPPAARWSWWMKPPPRTRL